jgi:hypothetical protein
LGQSVVHARSRHDWHGNTVDRLANFLDGFLQGAVQLLVDLAEAFSELASNFSDGPPCLIPRFQNTLAGAMMDSTGGPKLFFERAMIRPVLHTGGVNRCKPDNRHDQ